MIAREQVDFQPLPVHLEGVRNTSNRIQSTYATAAAILDQMAVGWVLLSEGIQKFLLTGARRGQASTTPSLPRSGGEDRGEEACLSTAPLLSPLPTPSSQGEEEKDSAKFFVEVARIFALALNSVGPFIQTGSREPQLMAPFGSAAIYTTKIPDSITSGFGEIAHEARTDFSMLTGTLFLFAAGAGTLSFDALLNKRLASPHPAGGGGVFGIENLQATR